MLDDIAEDQLTFAPGVAGIDQAIDLFAFSQAGQKLQARFGLFNRQEVKMRRDNGQVSERPLPAFDLIFLRCGNLDKVADGRRENEAVALKIIIVAGEAAQGAGNVSRYGGLLGDDEFLAHGGPSWRSD